MMRKNWFSIFLLLSTLILLTTSKAGHLIGGGFANGGMIKIAQIVIGDCHSCWSPDVSQTFEHAIYFDKKISKWYAQLGWVNIQQNNWEAAQKNLVKAVQLDNSNQQAWSSLGEVYDHLKLPEAAVNAYENSGEYASINIFEINRLELARSQIKRGDVFSARENLLAAIQLNPDSLWAWTKLALAPVGPDTTALQWLRNYHLPYITDQRSAAFMVDATMELLTAGLWGKEDALNVVKILLVRKMTGEANLLLQNLKKMDSSDVRVDRYLAEVASLEGMHQLSADRWKSLALRGNNDAWCYLGDENQSAGNLFDAENAYRECLNIFPDNQMAINHLAEICKLERTNSCSSGINQNLVEMSLTQQLSELTHTKEISLKTVTIDNGSFDQPDPLKPWLAKNWDVGIWDGNHHDRAAFYIDLEKSPIDGGQTQVLISLWRKKTELSSQPYAELHSPNVLIPEGAFYVVRFYYRTEMDAGNAFLVQVLDNGSPTFLTLKLPRTSGLWKEAIYIGKNDTNRSAYSRSLLRLWGDGAVWFDQYQVYYLSGNIDSEQIQNFLVR